MLQGGGRYRHCLGENVEYSSHGDLLVRPGGRRYLIFVLGVTVFSSIATQDAVAGGLEGGRVGAREEGAAGEEMRQSSRETRQGPLNESQVGRSERGARERK